MLYILTRESMSFFSKLLLSFLLTLMNSNTSKEPSSNKDYQAKDFSYLLSLDGFSQKLLSQHFDLYKGYVNQTNTLNTLIKEQLENSIPSSAEYSALKKAYAFEFNGMKLHELYFENLDKTMELSPTSPLYKKISQDFGSFDLWQKDFTQTGLTRGIGWVMCFYDKTSQKLINTWIESHDKGVPIFDNIIIIMDCWEHAYLQDWGIKRQDYIQIFMNHINWTKASERFLQSQEPIPSQIPLK
jgi:superoxide dismutase, Fe-Mn family